MMEASIIVIDDDEHARKLLTQGLAGRGWQVFDYAYAQINLLALQQRHPALMILNFASGTTEGKGWELLQLLKMEDTVAHVPILITTEVTLLSLEIRNYLLSRYIQIVYKPFDLVAVLALVQKTLTQASQRDMIFSSDQIFPVLVVDDTTALRETFAEVLSLEGYQVVTADNGLVALDTVSRADHSLILLDIMMPVMNGLEFLTAYDRQLRPHSPVIILSGETDIQHHLLPSFVVNVLRKPVPIAHLLKIVGKYAQAV